MMFKVDLHTHSIHSHDGGISALQYEKILSDGVLDAVAVTDHNSIDFAVGLKQQLGDKIIVGSEIMSSRGEIIGLYLSENVAPGLSPLDTIKAIKDQGGLVYIPHPFETFRKGIDPQALEEVAEQIDLIEVCNGRAFMQNRSSQAVLWSRLNGVVGAASSDAHGPKGLGRTYSSLGSMPTKETLVDLIGAGVLRTGHPSLQALLYPKYHKIRKRLRKK